MRSDHLREQNFFQVDQLGDASPYQIWIDDSTKELKLARQENSKWGEKTVEIVPEPLVLSHSVSFLMTGTELGTFNVGVSLFHIRRAGLSIFFFLKENNTWIRSSDFSLTPCRLQLWRRQAMMPLRFPWTYLYRTQVSDSWKSAIGLSPSFTCRN